MFGNTIENRNHTNINMDMYRFLKNATSRKRMEIIQTADYPETKMRATNAISQDTTPSPLPNTIF